MNKYEDSKSTKQNILAYIEYCKNVSLREGHNLTWPTVKEVKEHFKSPHRLPSGFFEADIDILIDELIIKEQYVIIENQRMLFTKKGEEYIDLIKDFQIKRWKKTRHLTYISIGISIMAFLISIFN